VVLFCSAGILPASPHFLAIAAQPPADDSLPIREIVRISLGCEQSRQDAGATKAGAFEMAASTKHLVAREWM
jgi:hypothetical protein